jgi:hypothetical protein
VNQKQSGTNFAAIGVIAAAAVAGAAYFYLRHK